MLYANVAGSGVIYPCMQVEAETQSDISESFEVEAVPTFVILKVCLHMHHVPRA